MKYIIMKAQEARDLEGFGSIIIKKQIKPAPPYIEGAVLERTGYSGEWWLMDETGRPIEGEDGAAGVYVPPVQSGDIIYICAGKCRRALPSQVSLNRFITKI